MKNTLKNNSYCLLYSQIPSDDMTCLRL
jgi:hypothetical protein